MSTAAVSTFFALLALACAAGTIAALVIAVAGRVRPDSMLGSVRIGLSEMALWLGGLVALAAMLGSLYYSEIAHYEPCELCWYQRICIYPLAPILLIAALRRDHRVWLYASIPTAVGVVIAVYHTQLQAFPEQRSFCRLSNPCTNRYVWEFGFISLPLMDLIALCFIATMLWLAATQPNKVPTEETSP